MIEDFFSRTFDLSKYPSDIVKDEWQENRAKLSVFFEKYIEYYKAYSKTKPYHELLFILNRPFHMLLGINEEKLYFAVSNKNAFMGRTYLYKLNDGLIYDANYMSKSMVIVGMGEPNTVDDSSVLCDVDISLAYEVNSENDIIIRQEAEGQVDYELELLKQRSKIMDVKPYFGEVVFKINPNKIFMLMPFADDDINDFYDDYIKKPLGEIDYNCVRADDIFNNKSIMDDIWRNINEARIIIADLTHRNPNVFYETGIAHTLGKDVILISQEQGDIPFDLRHIRTIFYKNTPRGAEEFSKKLIQTIEGIVQNIIIE